MDVAEASKHGKKSTSQKLEDQKKVGRIFFEYSLHIVLFYFFYSFTFKANSCSCVAFYLLLFTCSFCLLAKGMLSQLAVRLTPLSLHAVDLLCAAPQWRAKLE